MQAVFFARTPVVFIVLHTILSNHEVRVFSIHSKPTGGPSSLFLFELAKYGSWRGEAPWCS
jgi:hypothetical protein